jgi:hypothetical protein
MTLRERTVAPYHHGNHGLASAPLREGAAQLGQRNNMEQGNSCGAVAAIMRCIFAAAPSSSHWN